MPEALKSGRRVIHPGDVVKISRERGEYRVLRFAEDGSTVEVWGGTGQGIERKAKVRTFTADRIGRRLALAGTPEADNWA